MTTITLQSDRITELESWIDGLERQLASQADTIEKLNGEVRLLRAAPDVLAIEPMEVELLQSDLRASLDANQAIFELLVGLGTGYGNALVQLQGTRNEDKTDTLLRQAGKAVEDKQRTIDAHRDSLDRAGRRIEELKALLDARPDNSGDVDGLRDALSAERTKVSEAERNYRRAVQGVKDLDVQVKAANQFVEDIIKAIGQEPDRMKARLLGKLEQLKRDFEQSPMNRQIEAITPAREARIKAWVEGADVAPDVNPRTAPPP